MVPLRFISDPPLFPGNDHRFALDMSALPQKANIRCAKTMSALGHKPTYAVQKGMFALPPIATAKADACTGSCPEIEIAASGWRALAVAPLLPMPSRNGFVHTAVTSY
jgi:hypothetical protein